MERNTALAGGFKVVGTSEALPAVSSSTQIFANAPATCLGVLLTVRGAGLTIRFDGGTATAGANGNDYGVTTNSGPYEFTLNVEQAKLVRAIQNGGTATGWITYLGAC